tara:strand:- start:12 stop:668 length:657 start_codon:yes stop_codon:yes gene_type:complete
MKNKIIHIIFFSIFLSSLMATSTLRSLMFPGWGELNEFNILSEDNNIESIEYIKDRSKNLMIAESVIWISLFVSEELGSSYKNDFMLLAENNAGVDWSSIPSNEFEKYAANVGNFGSMNNGPDSYNSVRAVNNLSLYDEGIGYEWDWNDNNSNRLRYDKLRNRNGKLEKLSEYMVASLLINRIVSAFDVLSIKRNHGRMISFDVEQSDNIKLNFNYHF